MLLHYTHTHSISRPVSCPRLDKFCLLSLSRCHIHKTLNLAQWLLILALGIPQEQGINILQRSALLLFYTNTPILECNWCCIGLMNDLIVTTLFARHLFCLANESLLLLFVSQTSLFANWMAFLVIHLLHILYCFCCFAINLTFCILYYWCFFLNSF